MNTKLLAPIILSLLIGTGIGYSVSLPQISTLQSEKSSLESQISKLTTDYNNLNNSHNELQIEYELLDIIYRERETDFSILNATLNELQAACEEMKARIAELVQMADYEVYILTDGDYYQSMINDLKNANETTLVAMYSMIYDPDDSFDWANDLIKELVYADERGVNVSVVIEYRKWEPLGNMTANLDAYNYLLAHNVTVHLDNNENYTDHMKLVIIDDKIVYVGSHNWSESGLYYNHETSVRIVSEDIAKIFKEYLETTFGI